MPISATLDARRKRLCPMCGFEPCRTHECMFYSEYDSKTFECIFLHTYFLTGAAYANAARLNMIQRTIPLIEAQELRPEVLLERAHATDRAIEALEVLRKYPFDTDKADFGIPQILAMLQKHKEFWAAVSGIADKRQQRKRKK